MPLEAGDYFSCYTCEDWEDDTYYCFPGHHSQHCEHKIKPRCTGQKGRNMMILSYLEPPKYIPSPLRPGWAT